MIHNTAENGKAFILLHKENKYNYLMTDFSLKTKVYGFLFSATQQVCSSTAV